MYRHPGEYWRALRIPVLKLRQGSALVLFSVAGTVVAALLWLKLGLAAAAMMYAVTLGAVLMILYRHSRAEAHAMKRTHGLVDNENRGTSDRETKKVISSR
jgi:hypothetical protein